MKATPMRDVRIGAMVFSLTKFDEYDEVRETIYTRLNDTRYLHHGCIQGDPTSEYRPRYVNLDLIRGFEYPLVGALPVYPIVDAVLVPRRDAPREPVSADSDDKLQRLIRSVEEALAFLRPVDNGFPRNAHCARAKLREALIEARLTDKSNV